jgi:hypothetical protein
MTHSIREDILCDEDLVLTVYDYIRAAATAPDGPALLELSALPVNLIVNDYAEWDESDVARLRRFLHEQISRDSQEDLLDSSAVRAIATAHHWIDADRWLDADTHPSEAHEAFVEQWYVWGERRDAQARLEALARLATLMWVTLRAVRQLGFRLGTRDQCEAAAWITAQVFRQVLDEVFGTEYWDGYEVR